MASKPKPRLRVSAGSDGKRWQTRDSFQNFAASVGIGASNIQSGATYGFSPITRVHTQLEWAYRGSWIVRTVIDAVAEDMTREQIDIESDMPPDQIDQLVSFVNELEIWERLQATIKWSRLYGGCLAVMMIDGQKTETPLDIDRVAKGQFKGLMVLDRWMVWPHMDDPIKDLGKDYGMPRFYEVVSDARVIPHPKIHHSRCIRLDGVELPYWQKMAENYWGLSVLEPLWDRLLAFDSTTLGAAQLVYKAHLRTLKVEKLRELIAFGGPAYDAVIEQLRQIRLYQANEGITLLDNTDEFEAHAYAFGGLSDMMIQFAQQLSGAAQIPLVRLFGQSPAGLNATGDADIRNYYDFINSKQESMLRRPVQMLLELSHRSLTGEPLPDGFDFSFAPLWQLADTEKATVAGDVTTAVTNAQQAGIVSNAAALKELRQSSKITGIWSNITDEDIADAESAPPPAMMMGEHDQPCAEAKPSAPAKPEDAGHDAGEQPSDDAADPGRMARNTAVLGLLPPHAKHGHPSGLDEPKHLNERYGHLGPMAELRRQFPLKPADATTPAQIPASVKLHPVGDALPEELSPLIGPYVDSDAVWLVEQNNPETGAFERYRTMLGYNSRAEALDGFKAAFDDGRGEARMGHVQRMSVDGLRRIAAEWTPAGKPNGGIQL